MQISHRSQQPALSSSSLNPSAVNTPAPQKPVAAQARAQGSGFEAKSSFATASNKPLVSLTAQTAAPASATPGPLELNSPEARGAIQKSLDFIQKQSGGSSRGLVPGGDAQGSFSPALSRGTSSA